MRKALSTLVNDYGWIHLSLGLIGNVTFFTGSLFFLPTLEAFKNLGVWLFIVGSFLMMIGSIGRFVVDLMSPVEKQANLQTPQKADKCRTVLNRAL